MHSKLLITALVLPLALGACDGPSDPAAAPSPVTVKFSKSTSGAAQSVSAAEAADQHTLVVQGSNGTLEITDVRFLVAELELECSEEDDAVACSDFETSPAFVQLPLGTGALEVGTAEVPVGAYRRLEFEVEDLEGDVDDDSRKRTQLQELLATIRQSFPDFPAQASMAVVGTFTPAEEGAQPRAFRAYFDAEVEVELTLSPLLEINGSGASRTLTVSVFPEAWFKNGDGTVRDLSADHYAEGRTLPSIEVEIYNGFRAVEIDS